MITHYYPTALRVMTSIVAICSAVSATLMGTAPAPQGLKVLDPGALQAAVVVLVAALGVVAPVTMLMVRPLKYLLLKAALFTASGFGNAMTLSPYLAVPFQNTAALLAVIGSLSVTIASIVAYMESVELKNAERRASNT
ncbi:hypothetical protein ACFRJ9_11195 [Paenarthrobacter sp. NPDC056912]|uniref:hypothetical protein n=1 Tax=Paenarthrobacter sp. NPDC056912 TaxID=3345965 RepID=UPI00366A715A